MCESRLLTKLLNYWQLIKHYKQLSKIHFKLKRILTYAHTYIPSLIPSLRQVQYNDVGSLIYLTPLSIILTLKSK